MPVILSAAKNPHTGHCHSERSEESARAPAPLLVPVILSAAKNPRVAHRRFLAALRITGSATERCKKTCLCKSL